MRVPSSVATSALCVVALCLSALFAASAQGSSPLLYTAYLGAGGSITSIATGSDGSVYVTGTAGGPLPVTANALVRDYAPAACEQFMAPQPSPCPLAFAGRLTPDGSSFQWLTYLPMSNASAGLVSVDSHGNPWFAGMVGSSDLPVTAGAAQAQLKGNFDLYVLELNATGSAIPYATYLGGSAYQQLQAMAVDVSGNVYVSGYTMSTDFPITANALFAIPTNSFLTKLSSTGPLVYSTYFPSSVSAITTDAQGEAYLTGEDGSGMLPVTAGAIQSNLPSSRGSAYVVKITADGAISFGTYLGGSSESAGSAIALASDGSIAIAGSETVANSDNTVPFPVTPGAFQIQATALALQDATAQGYSYGFIARLNASGTSLVFSTALAQAPVSNVKFTSTGEIIAIGISSVASFPTSPGALEQCSPGYFPGTEVLLKLSGDGSSLLYATFLQYAFDGPLALDAADDAILTGFGSTSSTPYVSAIPSGSATDGANIFAFAPAPLPAGTLNCVGNAATQSTGAIAPGEVIEVRGNAIGPQQSTNGTVTNGSLSTTVSGTQLLINGIPAPILYADANRIQAVVPFEVGPPPNGSGGSAEIQTTGPAPSLQPIFVDAAIVAPGVYLSDANGHALVINQDGTLNSMSNPAPQGTVIVFYATGLNQTSPALATGQIATTAAPLMTTVVISDGGGLQVTSGPPAILPSPFIYAGTAPGMVAGITQVNALVPTTILHGYAQLNITVGTISSENAFFFIK